MDVKEFSARLKDQLYPVVYRTGVRTDVEPFALLVRHVNWLTLGRYALTVLPWENLTVKSALLWTARRGLSKHMLTIPFLFQVGLYLVVPGPSREWSHVARQVRADQTSLHSVIVQAVHFLDLETGANEVTRSQWGPIRFGGTASVTDIVNSITP